MIIPPKSEIVACEFPDIVITAVVTTGDIQKGQTLLASEAGV